MKKTLALILSCVMLLGIFAGCNNNTASSTASNSSTASSSSSETSEESSETSEEPITIRFISTATAGSAFYKLLEVSNAQFMEDHPNVTVNHEGLSSAELRTKLSVEFAANTPPDTSWIPQSYAMEYTRTDQIIDWAPIVEADAELKSWYSDAVWDAITTDEGRIIYCPGEMGFDSLYYNMEIFEANGWTPPETWSEFITLCDEMNAVGIAPMVTGGGENRFAWLAGALLSRTGGIDNYRALASGDNESMTSWDDPAYGFVEAMEKFKEMVDHNAYYPGCMGMTATEADEVFARGEAAMYYEGAWKPANFESAGGREFIDKVGRVDFPIMEDCPNGTDNNIGGPHTGYFVAKGLSEYKQDMVVELIKTFSNPEFQSDMVETGAHMSAVSGLDYDEAKISNLMNECVIGAQSATSFIPSMDAIAPPAVDLAIKGTAMPGILTGELSVEEAVAAVQKAAEDYVAGLQ